MRYRSFAAHARGVIALLASLAAAPALAGTLQVDPILVEIGEARKTGSVTIRNQESVPVTIRAYPLGWTQADGADAYRDSSALIVSPPIFTIPAGGTQLVRVGLRGPEGAGRAYRLIIEEVPEAGPAGGVRVALRLNLPLYAMIEAGRKDDIVWSLPRRGDKGWTIEATNRGAGYVRVDAASAAAATGLRIDRSTSFGTILPGSSRVWTVEADPLITGQAD